MRSQNPSKCFFQLVGFLKFQAMIDVSSKSCTSERHGCIPGSTFGHLAFVKVLVEVVSVIKPDHGSHDLEISPFQISVSAAGHARMVSGWIVVVYILLP